MNDSNEIEVPQDEGLDAEMAEMILERLVDMTAAEDGEPEGDDLYHDLIPMLQPAMQAAVLEQARQAIPGMSAEAERVLRQMTAQLDPRSLHAVLNEGPGHTQLLGYAALGLAHALAQEPLVEGSSDAPASTRSSDRAVPKESRSLVDAHLQAFGDSPKERKFILDAIREMERAR